MGQLKSRELRGVVKSENVCYGKERRVQCKYILITQKHRDGEKKWMEKKWSMMPEEITFTKIVSSTRITSLRNLGIFLCEVRSNCEPHMRKLGEDVIAINVSTWFRY